ncbi:ABC transporter permease [Streptomyces pinistramenti]|uniref:ABC transporter permease n=1 Tax=Streptomyces pinistramenti TaxID=2884812 RepID=UPI001D08E8CF|nr:ABC transporter permease [Streptomyces pinistramenti]MCB5909975.1 ABC transporter permease [Streptomyces pinistramenti]
MSDLTATLGSSPRDAIAMLGRYLTRMRHAPGMLVITLVAPLAMLVLFGYLFGSAIGIPGGGNYREYLVPGLFVSVAANGILTGMISTAQDQQRGVMDRFRTLPMSRFAVPFGQTASEVLVAAAGLLPLALAGLAVGWRVRGTAGAALGAFALLLLFRWAAAWIGQYLGMLAKSEETAGQLASLTFMLPMVSNTYVPTEGMPGWLRFLADWNPISSVVAACRELFGNAAPVAAADAAWPLHHPVTAALLWSLLLLAVFIPLCVHRYTHTDR